MIVARIRLISSGGKVSCTGDPEMTALPRPAMEIGRRLRGSPMLPGVGVQALTCVRGCGRSALALSCLPRGCYVDHSICDINGEPYRADEYGFAMMRSANKFDGQADFETPASCWGDVGAASGPLFLVLSALAHHKGYSPGSSTLLWTSSRGGLRSAALVQSTTTA